MSNERLWNIYAGLDFLTPGARETIDVVSTLVPATPRARILDVAYGKGTGAMLLAERHDCTVLGVDVHTFAAQVARRAAARGLGDRVAFAIGDGARLPVRDARVRRGDVHRRAEHRRHGALHRRDGARTAVRRFARRQ